MTELPPPNATALERSQADMLHQAYDVPKPFENLVDPTAVSESFLPFQAWQQSVDTWDKAWPVETRRRVVSESARIHKKKGTNGAVGRALLAAGYGEVDVLDGLGNRTCNGDWICDGTYFCSVHEHWAWFTVIVYRPVSIAQAQQIKRIINRTKREVMFLHEVRFDQVLNLCDGTWICDGTFTCGVVDGQSI